MFLSITTAIILLLSSVTAQLIVQPGYSHPSYGLQSHQPYMSPNYPVHYPTYPRTLENEYQRYQNLNHLVQQQITGMMQSNPNHLQSLDPTLGSSAYRYLHSLRPHHARPFFSGGRIFSLTPHGLRGIHSNRFILRNPEQEDSYADHRLNAVRNPSIRSVQSNDTNIGINSTSTSDVTNEDDVATNTPVVIEDLPEVQSLNESEDKHVDPRSTGIENLLDSAVQAYHQIHLPSDQAHPLASVNLNQAHSETPMESVGSPASSPAQIFDQIRPDFSRMGLHNEGHVPQENGRIMEEAQGQAQGERNAHPHKETPASHPSYSESTPSDNWLTDSYHNYMNKARTFMHPGQGYPGQSGYGAHSPYAGYPVAPMMQPASPMMQPMYSGSMPSYGGYNPYSAPGGATASSTATASSNSNNPYYRTAMDFVGKGLTYQPSDWARYGQNWANQGINMLGSHLSNHAMGHQPQGRSSWYQ